MLSLAVAASVVSLGAAKAQIFVVNGDNLDTPVLSESTTSSQTSGIKDQTNINNGGGTTIGTDPGAHAYWQGFKTGPDASGYISQLTLDLSVLASSAGVNANVSNPDTETFYLYTFPGGVITAGAQVGLPIATLTAAQIEAGTPVGYSPTNTSDVYQLSLINSLSTYHLNANTTYAIVMMTSNASQDVGWAESKTAATGDMGDFDNLNHGGNNGGSFGQMELAITPDITVTPEPASWMLGALALVAMAGLRVRSLRRS